MKKLRERVLLRIIVSVILVFFFVGAANASSDKYRFFMYLPDINSAKSTMGIESYGSARQTREVWNPVTPIKISCLWSDIQPYPEMYDFSKCGMKIGNLPVTWIDIKHTPEWALLPDEPQCHLPQPEHYSKLVDVIERLVSRYPSVKFVGIWNEPATPDTVDPDLWQFVGCLGSDGGVIYGEMVKYLYDNADIGDAQLIIGNLAGFNTAFTYDMLETADGHYDGVSFHCYAHSYGERLSNSCAHEYSQARAIMDQFAPDKVLHLSETAVIRYTGNVEQFEQAQMEHFSEILDLPGYKFWHSGLCNAWPELPYNADMWTRIWTSGKWRDVPRPVWDEYMDILAIIPQ